MQKTALKIEKMSKVDSPENHPKNRKVDSPTTIRKMGSFVACRLPVFALSMCVLAISLFLCCAACVLFVAFCFALCGLPSVKFDLSARYCCLVFLSKL